MQVFNHLSSEMHLWITIVLNFHPELMNNMRKISFHRYNV